jgi:hypothetical protein
MLEAKVQALASQFAKDLLELFKEASIRELTSTPHAPKAVASAPASNGRRARRSTDDIQSTVKSIVSVLKRNGGGMRAEQIKAAIGVETKDLPRPIAVALSEGLIRKKGEKRATTYYAR